MSTRSGLIFGGRSGGRHLHRDILMREAAEARSSLALARETLRAERAEATRAMREHRRAFARARAQALRDGRHLLRVIDHLPERD